MKVEEKEVEEKEGERKEEEEKDDSEEDDHDQESSSKFQKQSQFNNELFNSIRNSGFKNLKEFKNKNKWGVENLIS